jgi:hypothetical protein
MRTAIGLIACLVPALARGYGPEGHIIVGIAAELRLCSVARAQVNALGEGDSLADLGLWADRIRSARAGSAPWHYMNIADGASVRAFLHPPEGDVLEAIPRFAGVLADHALSLRERAEALRFLVHFIVDIHQPLHVGRASDRGGNMIELRLGRATTNLHRFWDSDVIELEGLSPTRYARSLSPALGSPGGPVELDPVVWAEESLALRGSVYEIELRSGEPDPAYLDRAKTLTRQRLAAATLRLTATLNAVFGC